MVWFALFTKINKDGGLDGNGIIYRVCGLRKNVSCSF